MNKTYIYISIQPFFFKNDNQYCQFISAVSHCKELRPPRSNYTKLRAEWTGKSGERNEDRARVVSMAAVLGGQYVYVCVCV